MFIPDALVHESWIPFLDSQRETLDELADHLEKEMGKSTLFFPDRELILRAFEMSVRDVRVLILGQDPYPTPGHAIGYAFATHTQMRPIPASLRNIIKEVSNDLIFVCVLEQNSVSRPPNNRGIAGTLPFTGQSQFLEHL